MNDKTEESIHANQDTQVVGSTLVDFLEVITKHRKFISRFVLLATVIVTVVTLLLPKWYRSTASVFPAEKAELLGALEGISSLAKNLSPARALSAFGSNPEADRYLAILKSGTVLGAVIERFKLDSVYDITQYKVEKTTKELLQNSEFTLEDEGNITITVYDKDPQRAADMANFFVDMLNKTNSMLQVQNAKGNREFIEERYKKNLADLAAAEDSLRAFQKRSGIVAMPEQTEASIKAAAEITAQLALQEVRLGVLKRTQSADNSMVIAGQIEVDELKQKLGQMGASGSNIGENMKLLVPFSKVPDLATEYIRRYRDVEIQYKILQFITPLYEQARVEERRQTPSVIVIDKAEAAERKSKPKVSLYALLALVISTMLSLLVVFSIEGVARLRKINPDRFDTIVKTAWSDKLGLRWKRGAP